MVLPDGNARLDRTTYIGGSGAATVLGLSDYDTALKYWNMKGPNAEKRDFCNPHMARGIYMEPEIQRYIRAEVDPTAGSIENVQKHDFEITTKRDATKMVKAGKQIFVVDNTLLNTDGLPIAGGHPDDLGDDIVWEYKAPTMYNFDRLLREGLPKTWTLQVQHYMMLTGLRRGCIALWNYNKHRPVLFYFNTDLELHDALRERYAWFWKTVESGECPTKEDFKGPYGYQWEVTTDAELDKIFKAYLIATDHRYDGETEQRALRGKIVTYAAGRDTLQTKKYTCRLTKMPLKNGGSWTKTTVSKVDPKSKK